MTKLTAVIVTYNRLPKLRVTLPKALAAGFDRIIVVDNASTDGTAAYLETLASQQLTVIRSVQNVGGAGGFARGIGAAHGADWIVLFDDDAWPDDATVDRFRAMAPELPKDAGVVAADVLLPDHTPSDLNRVIINPFWNLRKRAPEVVRRGRRGFTVSDGREAEVDAAIFVGFFLRGKAAKSVPLPDSGLFIYSDDILYSLTLRKAGWRILYKPDLRFIHDCETLASQDIYRPMWKNFYTIRNGVEVARQAAGPFYPVALGYLVFIWIRRGVTLGGVERREYFRLFRRALWHGVRRKRGTMPDDLNRNAIPAHSG